MLGTLLRMADIYLEVDIVCSVCGISHLPRGLRRSGLVGPCSRLSRGHGEPKERHRATPISPRNCMIRIIFFSHCIHFAHFATPERRKIQDPKSKWKQKTLALADFSRNNVHFSLENRREALLLTTAPVPTTVNSPNIPWAEG